MTIRNYLRILREQWVLVLVAVVVGVVAAGATFFTRPVEYTSTMTFYVSASNAGGAEAAQSAVQVAQLRTASYVQLVNSRRVAEEVVQRLRLNESPDDLSRQISASTPTGSVIIEVAITDTSPQRAEAIGSMLGLVFTDIANSLDGSPLSDRPATLTVVQTADVPQSPSSLGLSTVLVLGLLGGLVIGIGGALARNALDVSIKTPAALREVTEAANLGSVGYDPLASTHPLIVRGHPGSPRAEAFRQLRTNLQFVKVDVPRKVLTIISATPGEGKSTTTVNLAIAMASMGARVLVIDGDLRRPKVAELLGLDKAVGLTSVLAGHVDIDEAIQTWEGSPELDVLASGRTPPDPSELLASDRMRKLLADMRERYDVVLVDSPPVLPVTDAAVIATATDGAILVCRFGKTKRNDVAAAVESIRSVSVPLLGTVMTMVPASGSHMIPSLDYTYESAVEPEPDTTASDTYAETAMSDEDSVSTSAESDADDAPGSEADDASDSDADERAGSDVNEWNVDSETVKVRSVSLAKDPSSGMSLEDPGVERRPEARLAFSSNGNATSSSGSALGHSPRPRPSPRPRAL